jgi:hypothetical protein
MGEGQLGEAESQAVRGRRFGLFEMLTRIPAPPPEWTDVNQNDPGVTLLEVFAFLTENLLFRANQIPERDQRRFLTLLTEVLVSRHDGSPPKDERYQDFECSLAGGCRALLESEIQRQGSRNESDSLEHMQAHNEEMLLTRLGYSVDGPGVVQFLWDHQLELANTLHAFGLPHNCAEYCGETKP